MKQLFHVLRTIDIVRFWLRSVLLQDIDVMIGDIHEDYYRRILPKCGARRANIWLVWTLVTSVAILLGHRILRSLGLEIRPPRSPAEKLVLRDRGLRLVLIPAVGGAIGYISGFFGPYRPGSALFWAGLLWAIFMSFVLWHANRSSFLIQRQRYDGLQHRLRKMCVLLLINLFLTVLLAWLMLKMWYFFAVLGPDLTRILITRILITTLCGAAVIILGYDVCFWFSADNADYPTSP